MQLRSVNHGNFPFREIEMMREHVGYERTARARAENDNILHLSPLVSSLSGNPIAG
jgi:hypothetical protein